jgi:uncharacterized membrane protein SpoIIM required for sporulation
MMELLVQKKNRFFLFLRGCANLISSDYIVYERMLENLLNLDEINRNPFLMFIWALIIGSVGILISLQVGFQIPGPNVVFDLTGLFAVLFVIIPSIPFIILLITSEEEMEEEAVRRHYAQHFWLRHGRDVGILLFYFAGITLAFAAWSFLLPEEAFQVQITKINEIRGVAQGLAVAEGAAVSPYGSFIAILLNNLQVMMFAFLFSFAFGSGAIFIIVWNASILGVYIGQLSRSIYEIPLVSWLFAPHGIPEIAAYLFAGLAGGIMSAALIRKIPLRTLEVILLDAFKMLTVAALLILVAAGIEVYL